MLFCWLSRTYLIFSWVPQFLVHNIMDLNVQTEFIVLYSIPVYPRIVGLLEGEYVVTDDHYSGLLNIFADQILNRISSRISDLIPPLVQSGVLIREDTHSILAERANHGEMLATWELLFQLPCRKQEWFQDFMSTLINLDLQHVAEILDPDLCSSK